MRKGLKDSSTKRSNNEDIVPISTIGTTPVVLIGRLCMMQLPVMAFDSYSSVTMEQMNLWSWNRLSHLHCANSFIDWNRQGEGTVNTQKDYTSKLMTSEGQSNFSYSRQERIYSGWQRNGRSGRNLHLLDLFTCHRIEYSSGFENVLLCTAQLAQSADVNCNKVFIWAQRRLSPS